MIYINDRFYLFLKSFLLGLFLIGFLVFGGNLERLFIIAATLLMINAIKNTKLKFNYFLIIIIGLIIGYILGNFMLYYSSLSDQNNHTYRNGKYDEKLTKPAVIIFSNGEPDTFNLPIILHNIYSNKSIVRKINAPIEIFKSKMAYENIGCSKKTDLCNRIKDDLRHRLGIDYDVYIAYSNTKPLIDDEINRLDEKYEKLILVPLMLSESEEFKEFKKEIKKKYFNNDTQLKITPLLWKSQKLSKELLKKSIEITGKENIDSTGIVLLISNKYDFYKQSIFSNDVINKMEKSNFDKGNIICLKYDNKEKLLIKSIKKLSRRGTDNIIIINVSGLEDEIIEQNRIRNLVKKTSKKEFVNIRYLNGWGISENLLNELELMIRIANIKD